MRILHVTFVYPTPERPTKGIAIQNLVTDFEKQKIANEQFVIHFNAACKEIKEIKVNNCLTTIEFPNPTINKIFQYPTSKKLNHVLHNISPEFIFFHNVHPGLYYLQEHLNKNNTPYIISLRASCYRAIKFSYRRAYYKRTITKAKLVISSAPFFAKKVIELLNISESKIQYLPNHLQDEKFRIDTIKLKEKEVFKLLLLSNFEVWKNIENTYEAIRLVAEKRNIELHHYGQILNQKMFENLKAHHQFPIFYHGLAEPNSISSIIDAHDALILISNQEPFGLSLAEAVARKKPVIYTKNSGFSFFAKNRNWGLEISNNQDLGTISEAIENIIEHYNDFSFTDNNILKFPKDFWKSVMGSD